MDKMTQNQLEELSNSSNYEDRIKAAEDENCPTEILNRLSDDEDDEVRMHVAGHLNTSSEVLVKLSQDKMWEARNFVAQNPNTPIMALVHLLYEEDTANRQDAIRNPNVTTEEVSNLVNSGIFDQMVLAAMSEKCSYEDFVTLASYSSLYDDEVSDMKTTLSKNKKLPFHLFQGFMEKDKFFMKSSHFIGIDKDTHDNKHLTAIFDAFTDSKRYFGEENSYYARREQAKNPDSKPELLEELADDEMIEVREEVAKNPNAPHNVFEKLSSDGAGFIQTYLSMNPTVPSEVLETLYLNKKEHHAIRSALANNPNSPSYIIEELQDLKGNRFIKPRDNNLIGRDYFDYIAKHPSASGKLLDKVWKLNLDKYINYSIATHDNILFSTLKEMEESLDKNDTINKEVTSRLEVGYAEAKDKNTSSKRLEELSKYKYLLTKCYVAQNRNTSPETLNQLSHDKDDTVRYLVAQNLNTPLEVLKRLSNDEDEYVRAATAKNKNTSIEIINNVYKDNELNRNYYIALHKDTTFEKATEISQKYSNSFFNFGDYRQIWLLIDSTPLDKLKEIYSTFNEAQKYQFAIGKKASFATLKLLADEDKYFFKEYVYHHPNCTEEFKHELYQKIQQARDLRLIAIQKAEEEVHVASREARDEFSQTVDELFKNS